MEQPRMLSGLVAGSSPAQPSSPAAWVYILRGASGRHYIGSTENLQRRIGEHSRGNNHTTRRFGGDVQLLASKQFASMAQARAVELALKRKKNPQLAVLTLQSLKSGRVAQPRMRSGLVAGSSPGRLINLD
jgi:predicted GIY-YIG superfamily endonuclease